MRSNYLEWLDAGTYTFGCGRQPARARGGCNLVTKNMGDGNEREKRELGEGA